MANIVYTSVNLGKIYMEYFQFICYININIMGIVMQEWMQTSILITSKSCFRFPLNVAN